MADVLAPLASPAPGGEVLCEWRPRAALADYVASVWARRAVEARPLLPDAAVELVWSGRGLFIRGADTRPHQISAFPTRVFVGVRFRPGAAAAALGLGGRALADARIGVSELWGRDAMERLETLLAGCLTPWEAAHILEDAVQSRARRPPDAAVAAVATAFATERAARVAQVADRVGLSERQLFRRCVDALGYGPKTLERILRFQRFRRLAATRDEGLARLAASAGYADQAHLTRECLRLSGETPAVHRRPMHRVRFVQDGHPVTL